MFENLCINFEHLPSSQCRYLQVTYPQKEEHDET